MQALGAIQTLFGKGSSKSKGNPAESQVRPFSNNAPTWEELEALLADREAALQCAPDDPETGAPNPSALKRTFGTSEPIRVHLYRDHAAWCPYCQKVWLLLEEKQIPYTVEKINMRCYGDKKPSFTANVPSGMLPVLELDGRVITESALIMQLLESEFPERPMLPAAGTADRAKADQLMKLERQHFSAWMQWLTSSWAHDELKSQYSTVLSAVDQALSSSKGPYFLGADVSMVDFAFAPFLERTAASLAYYKGFHIRGTGAFPGVERWFHAMEQRPAYVATRADYYSSCMDLPPQLGGCAMHPEGEEVAAQIDGGAWHLPLQPLSATSLPEPYTGGENAPVDATRAAAQLTHNHAAVIKFAARGAGEPGSRRVSAPLADPTAVPSEAAMPNVDVALRHVAHALLVGVDDKQAGAAALEVHAEGTRGDGVAESLRYLRDRVGVPRDMPFPAARRLRAHINWFLSAAT